MPIDAIQTTLRLTPAASGLQPPRAAEGLSSGDGFGRIIGDALQQVDQLQQQASESSAMVATGQSTDLHTALLRVEEAGLAMQLALQVRNKLVESYQEIIRMPV